MRYYNQKYKTSGHLWQGRYKSFIVQKESYLITLLRYVEANPLRAKIVKDPIYYEYCSAKSRIDDIDDKLLDESPMILPNNWQEFINTKEDKIDVITIRNSIERQAPLGEESWTAKVSKMYGLESTLKPRGRPKKEEKK